MLIKRVTYLILAFTLLGCLVNCAKRGMPDGGVKDTIPPVFIKASPENYTTNFSEDEIRIYFNEYIKLENAQRNIIVSPPMNPKPEFYPMGSASKDIRIKILDTLTENTTYSINFGNSIVDNNEANPLPYFKYVFSTGSYVDSLQVSGSVKDAYLNKTDEFISVFLYEVDSTYSDSAIYQKTPTYLSYTQDSINRFQVENMKEGTYQMVAVLDKNQNYKFDPKTDKIGFLDSLITLPTDKNYQFKIFIEELDYEVQRPKQLSKYHLVFGYQGVTDSSEIEIITKVPDTFQYKIIKDPTKDTLHYWYKPFVEADSLVFKVSQKNYSDTVYTKVRDMLKDSLEIKPITKGSINPDENFQLSANLPLVELDTALVKIIDQDSIKVPFNPVFDELNNTYTFNFEKEENKRFSIEMYPGALKDFYENTNDTLNFNLKTPELSSLGTLNLTVNNIEAYPVIVQLTNNKGEMVKEVIHQENDGNLFKFKFIKPASYLIRLIYDKNNNGEWDTGSFLKKNQPEEIIYFPKEIEVRANWDVAETFILR